MQMAPSFILVAASGAAFLAYGLARFRAPKAAAAGVILALLLGLDFPACSAFAARLRIPWTHPPISPVSEYIVKHSAPDDTIWAGSGYNAMYYIETGRLSPTRYFYLFDWTLLSTRKSSWRQKREEIAAGIRSHPPKFILGNSGTTNYVDVLGLEEWVGRNYALTDVRDGPVFLYERRAR
jgi:hypothetical protein